MLTAVNVELDGDDDDARRDRPLPARRQGPGLEPGAGLRRPGQDRRCSVPARTLSDAARMMSHGNRGQDHAQAGRRPGRQRHAAGRRRPRGGRGDDRLRVRRAAADRPAAGRGVRPYRSRFPEEFGCTADLPAEAFAEAVRRVALVAERGTPVQLTFAPGRVTVGAATQGQARARESVPGRLRRRRAVIAFSPQYLLDGVIAATATAPVTAATAPATPPPGEPPAGLPPARQSGSSAAAPRTSRARHGQRAGAALVHQPEQARGDHPPAGPGRGRAKQRRSRLPLPGRPAARPVSSLSSGPVGRKRAQPPA